MKKKSYLRRKLLIMYYRQLSDKEILRGFRQGDGDIIRDYFYGYCQIGYNVFDQRYQLRGKQNLDFMSLAHQYAIYLMVGGPFARGEPENTDYQRIPLCRAGCAEMVQERIWQHHV